MTLGGGAWPCPRWMCHVHGLLRRGVEVAGGSSEGATGWGMEWNGGFLEGGHLSWDLGTERALGRGGSAWGAPRRKRQGVCCREGWGRVRGQTLSVC